MSDCENKTEETGEKRYTVEDILQAENIGDVLHAYRKSGEQKSSVTGLNFLQEAVANRARELGDEQTSKEFTILAIQTTNNERFLRGVDILVDVSEDFKRTQSRLGESMDGFKGSTKLIQVASEEFRNVASRIATAGNIIDEASRRMQHK